jgi:tetratricopeptide (TPR) repeat protein
LAISIGSVNRQCKALLELAQLKRNSGDFSGAKEDSSESQRVAKIAGNLYVEANALRVEAICWRYLGNYSHCISLLDRATHLLELCGMSGSEVYSGIRTSQAEIHRCKSEYPEAHNIQIQILDVASIDQNPYEHGFALLNLAQIGVEIGTSEDDVLWNINTASLIWQTLNYSPGLIYCDMLRAAVDVQIGNLLVAKSLLQNCLKVAWGSSSEAVTYCLEKLAEVQQWGPVDQGSFSRTVTFLAYSVKCKKKLEILKALQFLGNVLQALKDQETALSLFTAALDGFTEMDVHRSRAECMVRLGDISNLKGDPLEAVKFWEAARPLFEQSSQRKQLADLDSRLTSLSHNQLREAHQATRDYYLLKTHGPTEHLE